MSRTVKINLHPVFPSALTADALVMVDLVLAGIPFGANLILIQLFAAVEAAASLQFFYREFHRSWIRREVIYIAYAFQRKNEIPVRACAGVSGA
jgi:hypothetical protein